VKRPVLSDAGKLRPHFPACQDKNRTDCAKLAAQLG
jgi:hypothetical protein